MLQLSVETQLQANKTQKNHWKGRGHPLLSSPLVLEGTFLGVTQMVVSGWSTLEPLQIQQSDAWQRPPVLCHTEWGLAQDRLQGFRLKLLHQKWQSEVTAGWVHALHHPGPTDGVNNCCSQQRALLRRLDCVRITQLGKLQARKSWGITSLKVLRAKTVVRNFPVGALLALGCFSFCSVMCVLTLPSAEGPTPEKPQSRRLLWDTTNEVIQTIVGQVASFLQGKRRLLGRRELHEVPQYKCN